MIRSKSISVKQLNSSCRSKSSHGLTAKQQPVLDAVLNHGETMDRIEAEVRLQLQDVPATQSNHGSDSEFYYDSAESGLIQSQ